MVDSDHVKEKPFTITYQQHIISNFTVQ